MLYHPMMDLAPTPYAPPIMLIMVLFPTNTFAGIRHISLVESGQILPVRSSRDFDRLDGMH